MTISRDKVDNIKRVLITGGTSGIGYKACLKLLSNRHEVVIFARNQKRIDEISLKIRNELILKDISNLDFIFHILDLSHLEEIDRIANKLLKQSMPIDTLVLNAGLQYTGSDKILLSAQGLELTFAVNHLAHQLLAQKLMPLLIKSKKPRIIITSSEVHNPLSAGGRIGMPAGLGNLNGLRNLDEFEMLDGKSKFNADKAYKDSKLCNILFGKELSNRLCLKELKIPVITWAPGLVIPKSNDGFFRYSRKYNPLGQMLFAFIARDIIRITATPEEAGNLLYSLVTSDKFDLNGFHYYSNNLEIPGRFIFKRSDISKEAEDNLKAKELWELSNSILKSYCNFDVL
tara:strand:+ start:312 stop:1343 length:1032 start_codon:yes stop_codon:yes gene_type:complete